MTVTASGAITFSDIMNEFNSGGGQSNIKLGDYVARYPDNFGGIQEEAIYVAWDGYRFLLNGNAPVSTGTYLVFQGKLRLNFLLNSSCTVPFYIATTANTTGSNLVSSGVSNNGATWTTSGNYYGSGYVHVICDLSTAAGGTSEDIATKTVYINTNVQQTAGSGGANVDWQISSFPDTNRLVTLNRPYCDYTFNASYSGGGENVKVNSGAQVGPGQNSPQRIPGIIKTGTSITYTGTCGNCPDIYAGGSAPYLYFGYFYPVTYSGTGLAQGWSTGNYLGFTVYPYSGSGGNYISGGPTSSGSRPNTGAGFADYCRIGSMAIDSTFGTGSSSGWSLSAGGSGSTLEITITNNSGTDYVMNSVPHANCPSSDDKRPFWAGWTNTANTGANYTTSYNWGSGWNFQRVGANTYPVVQFDRDFTNGNPASGYTLACYGGESYNRANVITMLSNFNNTAGGITTGVSATYPGTQLGSSTGVYWSGYQEYPYAYANYPSTGQIRFRSRNGIGGTYKATSNPAGAFYTIQKETGWDSQIGSSNMTATATYSTGTSSLSDNAAVSRFKRNMAMSSYYGTRNLGTDGG